MKYRGPVITLLAVTALAAVLFVVNIQTVAQTAAQAPSEVAVPAQAADPGDAAPPEGAAPVEGAAPPEGAEQPEVPPEEPPTQEGQDPRADQATYAGRTSGNEATIAIAVDGGEVVAYVCDNKEVESWLRGTVSGGDLALEGDGDARATGSVDGDAVFGTVWVQGKQWPYSAQLAESPAGLYEGEGTVNGADTQVGWIVLQDGSQVGLADVGGARRPAPPLDPATLSSVELDGATITPRPVGGRG